RDSNSGNRIGLAAIHFQRLSTGVLGCIHDTTTADSARPPAKAYVECSGRLHYNRRAVNTLFSLWGRNHVRIANYLPAPPSENNWDRVRRYITPSATAGVA